MTTVAVGHGVPPTNRTIAAVRVLLVNPWLSLGLPLGILGSSFIVNLMIFAASDAVRAAATTGGVASIYVSQLIIGWISVHQGFSFAVGLNVTRRAYYSASVLVALGQSLLYALVLYLGGIIERATGGWGVNLPFFDPVPSLTDSSSPVTYLVYAVPLAFLTLLGLFLGTVTKRFGALGFFLLAIADILVVGGVVALITHLDGWGAIGAWFAHQSLHAIVIGWTLVPAALSVVLGWLVLRRAVP